MTKTKNFFTAFVLAAGALTAGATGCELIAKVDTSKVPSTGGSTGTGGSPVCATAGAMSCTTPTDCPAAAAACTVATCVAGCCGTGNAQAETSCTQGGGAVCDGMGSCVACVMPTDCAAQSTACVTNTCTGNACGTMKAAGETACTDNGGKVCDGNGTCVGCLMASDCAAQTTVCKINACDGTAHTCSTTPAAKGTTCTDSGGVVCDGAGACVSAHCTDGVKDVDETDVDCGGSCGGCADNLKCMTGADCIDKICDSTAKTCTPPSCTDGVQNGLETDTDCGGTTCDGQGKKCADTKHCTLNGDCTNSLCFGSNPGTCVSCGDGVKDGNETDKDCGGPQCDTQGKTCPAGDGCTTAGDCTNATPCSGTMYTPASTCNASNKCVAGTPQTCTSPTGVCNTTSGCVQCNSASDCAAASCSNGILTPADTCNASNVCVAGTPAACANGVICASTTACKASCSSDTDCEGTGVFCKNPGANGKCVTDLTAGTACTGDDQCVSGMCGINHTGHCCSMGTTCTGGTCGATDCNGTGGCFYPTTACTATSCPTPGDKVTTYLACDGLGACKGGAGAPQTCGGNFTCATTGLTCRTTCPSDDPTGDMSCQATFYCNGTGGMCVAQLASMLGPCTRNGECISGTCCLAPLSAACTTAGNTAGTCL